MWEWVGFVRCLVLPYKQMEAVLALKRIKVKKIIEPRHEISNVLYATSKTQISLRICAV